MELTRGMQKRKAVDIINGRLSHLSQKNIESAGHDPFSGPTLNAGGGDLRSGGGSGCSSPEGGWAGRLSNTLMESAQTHHRPPCPCWA